MQNLEEIRKRFLKNNLKTQLGCIASDLARLESFSKMPNNQKVIRDLIEESKFFIEWIAPKVSLGVQEELVKLQIQLALRSYSLKRKEITKSADKWSKKILKLSRLLNKAKS
jgi:hypothetical protein